MLVLVRNQKGIIYQHLSMTEHVGYLNIKPYIFLISLKRRRPISVINNG
jgi:hypothetical protein